MISVITAVYNGRDSIAHTIESVLQQSFSQFEYIIVDDCSTDDTAAIVKEYAKKDDRIKYTKLSKNSGVAAARNYGISQSVFNFICFVDADDIWLDNKLRVQYNLHDEHGIKISCTGIDMINEDRKVVGFQSPPTSILYSKLLKNNVVATSTVMINKSIIRNNKLFEESLEMAEDYCAWLRISKTTEFVGLKKRLVIYKIAKNSLSGNKFKMAKFRWKVYRKYEKINFLKSIYYICAYAFHGLVKHKFLFFNK